MSRQNWKPGNMLYPLPAVMVSCAAAKERPNIITVAWAGTVCTNPAMVSISIRPERYSYSIIRDTGEFVINLTTKKLVRAADYCGVRSGRDVDKFKEAHLTAIPAVHVGAPLIAESPVNIECRVREVLELGSHHMFLSEVLGVDVDDRYLDDKGKLRLNDAELMVYSHGTYYELGKALGTFGYSVRRKEKNNTAARGRKKHDEGKMQSTGSGLPC
ncbi:MAG: flavin reductase family protein [Clostridiales bacterium]|nr:flavin reductase family protein [Clostridiales bacterium]